MRSRRALLAASILFLPLYGHAQSSAAAFAGEWQGDVPGIGEARLIISAIKPNGQVEGRMEFTLNAFVSTFADQSDSGKRTNYGVVSGSTLTIEAALGGTYALVRDGERLTGTYTRGTTYKVAVSFRKS